MKWNDRVGILPILQPPSKRMNLGIECEMLLTMKNKENQTDVPSDERPTTTSTLPKGLKRSPIRLVDSVVNLQQKQ